MEPCTVTYKQRLWFIAWRNMIIDQLNTVTFASWDYNMKKLKLQQHLDYIGQFNYFPLIAYYR